MCSTFEYKTNYHQVASNNGGLLSASAGAGSKQLFRVANKRSALVVIRLTQNIERPHGVIN